VYRVVRLLSGPASLSSFTRAAAAAFPFLVIFAAFALCALRVFALVFAVGGSLRLWSVVLRRVVWGLWFFGLGTVPGFRKSLHDRVPLLSYAAAQIGSPLPLSCVWTPAPSLLALLVILSLPAAFVRQRRSQFGFVFSIVS
jgi:hypothetical protein